MMKHLLAFATDIRLGTQLLSRWSHSSIKGIFQVLFMVKMALLSLHLKLITAVKNYQRTVIE